MCTIVPKISIKDTIKSPSIKNKTKDNIYKILSEQELLDGYKAAVSTCDISSFVGFSHYKEVYKNIVNELFGIETKDGIITKKSPHFIDRIIGQIAHDSPNVKGMRKGEKIEDVEHTLKNPSRIKKIKVDGEYRSKYSGDKCFATIDTDRGRLIQTNPFKGDKK
ncbi:MAG: hypothetical protein Q4B52_08170 [Tissierellia bacterium]|nr:hypothetical protein [Tissierellia bacterium]